MVDPNWELKNCCQHEQVVFLVTIGVFTLVILAIYVDGMRPPFSLEMLQFQEAYISSITMMSPAFFAVYENGRYLQPKLHCYSNDIIIDILLWRTFLLTPFKLITVFLHEVSHAIACKLTCGQVEGIQVHANEGGVTQTRGGIYWLILPAGYLGSSFWGMVLVLASTKLLTARIAAGCLILSLVIVFFIAKNWTLRGLCIGFIVFIAIIWVLQETTKVRLLRYVILFIGVMNSLFSVYDIYDDLISRRVNSSDAEKFAELCPCPCNGAAWGVIWGVISFIFLSGSIYLGLVILS